MEIPGYRYDAATDRYFKLDARFDANFPPGPPPPAPLQQSKRAKTAVMTVERLRDRVFSRLELSQVPCPSATAGGMSNLLTVGKTKGLVCGMQGNRLVVGRVSTTSNEEEGGSPWRQLKMYPDLTKGSGVLRGDGGHASLLAQLPVSSSSSEAPPVMVHYSPHSNLVSFVELQADDRPRLAHSVDLATDKEMTCMAVGSNSNDDVILLGRGLRGVCVREAAVTPLRIPGGKAHKRIEPLCLVRRQNNVLLVGLRQGSVLTWDQRVSSTTFSQPAGFGPVCALWEHGARSEHLVTCYAPNGDPCQPSCWLLDMRFEAGKPVAAYDLHCPMTSPAPLVMTSLDSDHDQSSSKLLIGLDARTHQYRVFDMDSAKFVRQIDPPGMMPADVNAHAILSSVDPFALVACSRSRGMVRLSSQV